VNVEPQPQPVDVRKPPIGAVLRLHPQGQRGLCGWCGLPVTETTPVRGYLKYWHDACAFEMGVIESPEQARAAVLGRDHGICADCGEDWSDMVRFAPAYPATEWHRENFNPDQLSPGPKPGSLVVISYVSEWNPKTKHFEHAGPHVELTVISLWHVDHKVPLWKVRHLPPLQRLEYFKLANLITRCEPCHKLKSKKEASERAHFNELAGENKPKFKSKFGTRRMPCGRDSQWTKRMNGKVEKRNGQPE
jgi:5-methylcytosine-specific restriction endonuclease McrA